MIGRAWFMRFCGLYFAKVLMAVVLLCVVSASIGQQKVTYGKSTFTVYAPLDNLAPTPLCGFSPDVAGYTLKSKNYGPGTYYCYAPGNVPKTGYECIFTEIRDWVGHRPETVAELASKRGLTRVAGKDIKKMFKNSRLPNDGLMYRLTPTSWIWFYVSDLQNCGSVPWASHEPYVLGVSYIECVPRQTGIVLDKIYRFWNDGVRFADYAGVVQSNFKTRPSAPSDPNPNNFTIGDVLNRSKGFYSLSFDGGKPVYKWHSYEGVVEANLKKDDFDLSGSIGYNDLFSAFTYELDAVVAGKKLYFSYSVNSVFLHDIEPGRTWQKEMASRKEQAETAKIEMDKVKKSNSKALEMLYQEIFK